MVDISLVNLNLFPFFPRRSILPKKETNRLVPPEKKRIFDHIRYLLTMAAHNTKKQPKLLIAHCITVVVRFWDSEVELDNLIRYACIFRVLAFMPRPYYWFRARSDYIESRYMSTPQLVFVLFPIEMWVASKQVSSIGVFCFCFRYKCGSGNRGIVEREIVNGHCFCRFLFVGFCQYGFIRNYFVIT